ncbi:hypothetical protein F3Y22_tig00111847pilonHSYRG00296 [Hibiscus syriacus]|uniref:Reverse transcriptase Ty1/copia-type domain-containing protein n=1 Tax=Hibiscus syriacus TaxID=106335 RepID=A0A6A2XYM3_HIBSY|nr:hypothetical protein F3Y22_tig00111847pilonHSYRG00296 [Hibiscus syriacus]
MGTSESTSAMARTSAVIITSTFSCYNEFLHFSSTWKLSYTQQAQIIIAPLPPPLPLHPPLHCLSNIPSTFHICSMDEAVTPNQVNPNLIADDDSLNKVGGMHAMIKALCVCIAKNGPDYEDVVRKSEHSNPEYAFLYVVSPEVRKVSPEQPYPLVIATASHSPGDSDMEMEGNDHSSKGLNSQCINNNMLIVKEQYCQPVQISTEGNASKDILSEKEWAADSSRLIKEGTGPKRVIGSARLGKGLYTLESFSSGLHGKPTDWQPTRSRFQKEAHIPSQDDSSSSFSKKQIEELQQILSSMTTKPTNVTYTTIDGNNPYVFSAQDSKRVIGSARLGKGLYTLGGIAFVHIHNRGKLDPRGSYKEFQPVQTNISLQPILSYLLLSLQSRLAQFLPSEGEDNLNTDELAFSLPHNSSPCKTPSTTTKNAPNNDLEHNSPSETLSVYSRRRKDVAEESVSLAFTNNQIRILLHMNRRKGNVTEAFQSPEWKKVVEEEIKALQKNKTWSLIALPEGKRAVWRLCTGCKIEYHQNMLSVAMIIITESDIEIEKLKMNLAKEFETKDLGSMRYFLGMEVARSEEGLVINQRKYVLDLLAKTMMLDCNQFETPMEPGLNFARTRLEIHEHCHQHMSDPREEHLEALQNSKSVFYSDSDSDDSCDTGKYRKGRTQSRSPLDKREVHGREGSVAYLAAGLLETREAGAGLPETGEAGAGLPVFLHVYEFCGEKKRRVKGHMPFCFDFRRASATVECLVVICTTILARVMNQDSDDGGVHYQDIQSNEYSMIKSSCRISTPVNYDRSSVGKMDTLKFCANASQQVPASSFSPLDPVCQNANCQPQQSDNVVPAIEEE